MFFSVTGEYITDIARSWFYDERRPYKEVEELLLSCMGGTDTPIETLKGYAYDVINFTKKFIGDTRDDSFMLVDEEDEKEIERLKKEYPLYKYTDEMINSGKIPFEICQYGFIDNDGKYIPIEWCQHYDYAYDWINNNLSIEDLMASQQRFHALDFMINEKGWILIHNPHQGQGMIQRPSRINKKQKETLYDYYIYFGRNKEASDLYLDEEDDINDILKGTKATCKEILDILDEIGD